MKRPRGRPRQFTADELRRRRNARRKRWRKKRGEARRLEENRRQRAAHAAHGQEREACKAITRRAVRAFLWACHKAGEQLTVVTAQRLDKPPLLFIDELGRVWHEDFRSAQQLIAAWQRKHRKRKGAPHGPQERRV